MKKKLEIIINSDFESFYKDIIPESRIIQSRLTLDYESDYDIIKKMKDEYQNIPKDRMLFWGWRNRYVYSKRELEKASLFLMSLSNHINLYSEEIDKIYNYQHACPLCGAGRTQEKNLAINTNVHERYDICQLLSGEIIVSEKIIEGFCNHGIKIEGNLPITSSGKRYYQLKALKEAHISKQTVFGINPFDLRESDGNEVYQCPNEDTLGLNLISELIIEKGDFVNDIFLTKQFLGVRRGLLTPQPLWLCTSKVRQYFIENHIKGLEFEIARII